ncbi:MAG: hypothetical protein QY326_09020 [Bdellovibrionota bacterium]|nr:MAG: hypothetical protein QY326_09020 [Bdellovibrionota bacterium]
MPYPNHPSAKESLSNASVGSRPNLESAVAIAKHLDLVEPQLETGRINPPELAAELRDLSQITLTERAAPVMFPELLPRLKELHTELNSLEPPQEGPVNLIWQRAVPLPPECPCLPAPMHW